MNSRSTPSAKASATPGTGVTPAADARKTPQSIWPRRVTPETITAEQIREFYTGGTWPEKMVYCDVLKIIGDLAIMVVEYRQRGIEVRDAIRALAVGEPCAGYWADNNVNRFYWSCRCGAQSPADCKTETANEDPLARAKRAGYEEF